MAALLQQVAFPQPLDFRWAEQATFDPGAGEDLAIPLCHCRSPSPKHRAADWGAGLSSPCFT